MNEKAENIIPFDYENNAIRVVVQDNEPWFAATDIAKVLDYRDANNLVRILDDDEKGTHKVSTLGGSQELLAINESGLYSAIFTSRKPEAKRFKKWVTSEVLPSIRKTGAYIGPKASEKMQLSYRLMSLQQHSWKLMKNIKAETNKEIRRHLYEQLEAISLEMAMAPPPLEELGSDAPDVPPEVPQFWAVYDALVSPGVEVNHTRRPGIIAVSLIEIEQAARQYKLKFPDLHKLKKSLRLSRSPLFIEGKNVTSCTNHKYKKSVRCWIFEQVPEEE